MGLWALCLPGCPTNSQTQHALQLVSVSPIVTALRIPLFACGVSGLPLLLTPTPHPAAAARLAQRLTHPAEHQVLYGGWYSIDIPTKNVINMPMASRRVVASTGGAGGCWAVVRSSAACGAGRDRNWDPSMAAGCHRRRRRALSLSLPNNGLDSCELQPENARRAVQLPWGQLLGPPA